MTGLKPGNNAPQNTFIYISENGNYHIVFAQAENQAYARLQKEVKWEPENIKACLELRGTQRNIIDHEKP